MRFALGILALWVLGSGVCHGATRNFGMADGLATVSVEAIAEDRSGALWFGASDGSGLSRYDGGDWRTYVADAGPPSASVTCLLADGVGRVWLGTGSDGVALFDRGVWRAFAAGDLTSSEITCLFEDSAGRIWAGTRAGLNVYDGAWRRFSPGAGDAPSAVNAIAEDLTGNVWVATPFDLRRWNGAGWSVFARSRGTLHPRVPLGALTMRSGPDGRIWCGFSSGVAGFDPSLELADSLAWEIHVSADALSLSDVRAIESDPEGNLWFGHRDGLSRFDGFLWRDYATPGVLALRRDQSGNLWLGWAGGVQVFDRVTLELFSEGIPGVGCEDQIAPGGARAIHQDSNGRIWLGTCGGGVVRRDRAGWSSLVDSLPSPRVSAIAADSTGTTWLCTDRGVVRHDGASWMRFGVAQGLASDTVRTLSPGPLGRMWFGTARGLSSFDGAAWRAHAPPGGPAFLDVLCLTRERSGALWMGAEGGASRFDGEAWTSYPIPSALPSAVTAIAEDRQGRIWFGTRSGLRVLDGIAWSSYTSATAALADDWIGSILVDRVGAVWVGTRGGISRFDGSQWVRLGGGGLANLFAASMFEDISGDLWFGIPRIAGIPADEGALLHTPDRVPPQTVTTAPPAPLSANTVQTIRYVAGFRETEGVEFSHSLDGEDFRPWSGDGFRVVNELPDGTHRFVVKARDGLLQEDPTPDTTWFEVDARAPEPRIASPLAGAAIRDSIAITGNVSDLRFRSYRVLLRREGASSWNPDDATELASGAVEIPGGVLAGWNTRPYPDGIYELRAEVTDTLGLVGSTTIAVQVDNSPPWAVQTSPARILAATGGDVYTLGREVHLYLPPHAFAEDVTVTIASLPSHELPDSLPGGFRPVTPAYSITWGDLPLEKRALVDFRLEPSPGQAVSLWRRGPSGGWSPLGGTIGTGGILSSTVSEPGVYGVFTAGSTPFQDGGLSGMSLTPRVLSRSGFSAGQVGIGFVLGRPGRVTVGIYDRAGREVRELAREVDLPGGANLLRWDGRDRDGGMVSDGIYLVAVRAHGERRILQLAVVR